MKLQIKGPKEVLAGDFTENSMCEIVDPKAFIAQVSKNGKLNLEVTVQKGRGYIPVENKAIDKLPLGTIAVDSIYTPVKKIHYEVENTRVGKMTNFDKLTIEITTDGSIDPEIALKTAANILIEHLNLIQNAFSDESTETPVKQKKIAKKKTTTKSND